mmetsp:Transcript_139579/g.348069  ORF Transcript_139579/g.348069 Transcript_139579/m.348069 type:complete len:257 (-) Transcript_139579:1245-2015(-)
MAKARKLLPPPPRAAAATGAVVSPSSALSLFIVAAAAALGPLAFEVWSERLSFEAPADSVLLALEVWAAARGSFFAKRVFSPDEDRPKLVPAAAPAASMRARFGWGVEFSEGEEGSGLSWRRSCCCCCFAWIFPSKPPIIKGLRSFAPAGFFSSRFSTASSAFLFNGALALPPAFKANKPTSLLGTVPEALVGSVPLFEEAASLSLARFAAMTLLKRKPVANNGFFLWPSSFFNSIFLPLFPTFFVESFISSAPMP